MTAGNMFCFQGTLGNKWKVGVLGFSKLSRPLDLTLLVFPILAPNGDHLVLLGPTWFLPQASTIIHGAQTAGAKK